MCSIKKKWTEMKERKRKRRKDIDIAIFYYTYYFFQTMQILLPKIIRFHASKL